MFVVLCGYVLLAGVAARFVALNVSRGYPQEYRENAMILSTSLMLEGKNPYAVEVQPVYINDYGILYNLVVLPFAAAFGPTFLVHRIVSVACIVLACACLFRLCRTSGISRAPALIAAAALFAQLSAGWSIVSRPDALGQLLFLGAVAIPYRYRFSRISLVLSGVLSALGFLAKPYFVIGAPCVALYLFLFESKGKGLCTILAFVAAMLLVVLGVNALFECYFTNVFFIHLNFSWRDAIHLKTVLKQFLAMNAGFLALVAWAWGFLFGTGGVRLDSANRPSINLGDLRRPLLTQWASMPVFMALCGSAAILAVLGWHPGNGILYYHQLVTPFFLWCVVWLADRRLENRWPALALILLNLFVLFRMLDFPTEDHTPDYRDLGCILAEHDDVLHCGPLAHLIDEQGKTVYDAGQTEYYRWGRAHNFTSVAERYMEKGAQYHRQIEERIRQKQFDLVVITKDLHPLVDSRMLAQRYILRETLPMNMMYQSWEAEVWEPREEWDVSGNRRQGSFTRSTAQGD